MEIMLIIIVFCVIMSAYFSATETAFSTFNRIRVKNMAEDGNKRARLVIRLSDDFDTLISTILIGNNIVNILASSLATVVFGMLIINDAGLSTTLSTIVMTVAVLTFGEIVPKSLAKNFPEKFCMFSAPIINALCYILFPISIMFRGLQRLLVKIFKKEDDTGITEDELISIIEEAEEDGGIDEEDGALIKSAIEFNELEVSEIFTPRIDITAVSADVTAEEMHKIFFDTGYSRIPVYDGDIDNITGLIYYKDFYALSLHDKATLSEIIKPVMYVPKTQKISDLLRNLQSKQMHMAIVVDEYGSTAGIVTLEDIIEEIVGEIWDEHDEIIEEIKKISDTEYIVTGNASLEKLFDELDLDVDDNELTDTFTANGWAMNTLGRIPEEGDEFEALGLSVKVLKVEGHRVEELHILVNPSEDGEDEDEE